MSGLGERLRKLRLERKLTQREVAEQLGIGVSTLGMYEGGWREPDLDTLMKLARFYGVTTDYLVGVDDSELSPEDQLRRLGAYLRGSGATDEDVELILQILESRQRLRERARQEKGEPGGTSK